MCSNTNQLALLLGQAEGYLREVGSFPDELSFQIFQDFDFVNLINTLIHVCGILYVIILSISKYVTICCREKILEHE